MTGDQADVFIRLKQLIPKSWFGSSSPYLDAVLQGYASAASWIYTLYYYAKLQTRIRTATDGWLDMISADFFGSALPRAANQSDASFKARILANLFRERGTRNAVTRVLVDLTGRVPHLFEPSRPADTGAYGTFINAGLIGASMGYGVAGGYGSLLLPYQAFVTAYRPTGAGVPNVAGYGTYNSATPGTGYLFDGSFIPMTTPGAPGGYGAGQIEYASLSMIQQAIADADIYAAVDSVMPAGTIAWTAIK